MGLFARIASALGLRKQEPRDDGDETNDPPRDHDDQTGDSLPLDDPERDPELEAKDDCGSFDFERDIARFFTAEFRVEQAWNNRERRQQLFSEYDIRDGAHWFQIRATFERWLETPEGKAKYPDAAALSQARMTTTQTVSIDELEQMIEDARRAKG
ncbi:MAG TPA: hypothetical protein VK034_11845 [Enhygromyxa sp.]|nr:hypothetical protein [Enhygromyxa sp.]